MPKKSKIKMNAVALEKILPRYTELLMVLFLKRFTKNMISESRKVSISKPGPAIVAILGLFITLLIKVAICVLK